VIDSEVIVVDDRVMTIKNYIVNDDDRPILYIVHGACIVKNP